MTFYDFILSSIEKAPVYEESTGWNDFIKKLRSTVNVEKISRSRISLKYNITGDFTEYEKWTFIYSGNPVKFSCSYSCESVIPRTLHVKQCINNHCRRATILYRRGGGSAAVTVESKIKNPGQYEFISAASFHRLFLRKLVDIKKNFGVLDCSAKPVGEYPVSGAYNTELTIKPDFNIGSKIYPSNTEYVEFTNIRLVPVRGVFNYKGRTFGLYDNNKCYAAFRFVYTIRARTNVRITSWGNLLTVLYSDMKHTSQMKLAASGLNKALNEGESINISLDVPIPHWCYGYVNVASAINVYHNGMYVYGGGPMYNIYLCRGLIK